jgi:hypothetical protein
VVLVEIHQPEQIDGLAEEMQRRSPEAVVTPTVAAIEHHAPSIRRGEHGTLAVTDVEDISAQGKFLEREAVR